jgi:hypothetical protein
VTRQRQMFRDCGVTKKGETYASTVLEALSNLIAPDATDPWECSALVRRIADWRAGEVANAAPRRSRKKGGA